MSIPDYTSPIVGYRVWTWGNTGLKSLCGTQWRPGQALEARCKASAVTGTVVGRTEKAHDTHDAPEANCTCGIYAAKTFDHFSSAGYQRYGIHGQVYLWGKVVEHELGYRAQFAYPRYLVLPPHILLPSSAPIEDRLGGLVAYGTNIFVGDDNSNIPLWTAHSGSNRTGLDYLIEIGKEYCDRRHRDRILKKGDLVAVVGRGVAIVDHVDSEWIQAVVLNRCVLRIVRKCIRWNRQYMRWEANPRHVSRQTEMRNMPASVEILASPFMMEPRCL
jgi:hypothetical protein